MTFVTFVAYPNKPDTTFNTPHYLETHMPLAEKVWKPLGMLKWELVNSVAGADGDKGLYAAVNVLTWKDRASYEAAFAAEESSAIWEDVPNVCNHGPSVVVAGDVAGSS